MPKRYNHFSSYEWLGEFWIPGQEVKLTGKLIYSPEDGITLEFFCPFHRNFRSSYLHGVLNTSDNCTLFGNFDLTHLGFNFGQNAICNGRSEFDAAIFGIHTTPDDEFPGFALDMTNFQEFCFPQGWKDRAPYSQEPLVKCEHGTLEVSIGHAGTFSLVGDDVANLFHCDNTVVREKISDAFRKISDEHPEELILKRNDIRWELVAKSSTRMVYGEICRNIASFELLLALLIFSPVQKTEVSVLPNSVGTERALQRMPLLISFFDVSKHKIEVLQKIKSNLNQAIALRNIGDFSKVISNWIKHREAFQSFASQITNRFGRYHEHELKASIVLYLVQLEEISKSLGAKDNNKYDFAFDRYDKIDINGRIESEFGLDGKSTIGEELSRLRAEIAHLGRPNQILRKIGYLGLFKTVICLEIIIATHIYEVLGIPDENIVEFQKQTVQILGSPQVPTKPVNLKDVT